MRGKTGSPITIVFKKKKGKRHQETTKNNIGGGKRQGRLGRREPINKP